jgi:hypothetical protein
MDISRRPRHPSDDHRPDGRRAVPHTASEVSLEVLRGQSPDRSPVARLTHKISRPTVEEEPQRRKLVCFARLRATGTNI